MVCKNLSIKVFSLIGITLLLTILSVSSLFAYYAYTADDITEFICIIVFTFVGFSCILFPVCKICRKTENINDNYEIFTISEESEIREEF
jgi:hypothetical protein